MLVQNTSITESPVYCWYVFIRPSNVFGACSGRGVAAEHRTAVRSTNPFLDENLTAYIGMTLVYSAEDENFPNVEQTLHRHICWTLLLTSYPHARSAAEVASDDDPDATIDDNDTKRASTRMLHSIVQADSAFETPLWFTVDSTLGNSSHVVVVAASGAALCTCLETPRTGMLCRHITACLPRIPVGTVGEGAQGDSSDTDGDTPPERAASMRREVDVRLTVQEGQGLGLRFDFFDREGDAVKVKGFCRSDAQPRVKLPAEASGLIAIGDVVTAIDGTSLRCLSRDSADEVIRAARDTSPLQTILTIMKGRDAGGSKAPSGAAASAAVSPSFRVAQQVAVAVFRNTQRRWLRPTAGSEAFCITSADGAQRVLAKVVALAAQRFGAAAAGVVTAESEEAAAAPDEASPGYSVVIHANIFALARKFCQELKALPPQQAMDVAKATFKIGHDKIVGAVHDPLVTHKRSHKALGKRSKAGSSGTGSKKPKS
jgi:hypothetical protein